MRRILIGLALLGLGCHHRAEVTPAPAWRNVEVAITVVNHNWSDARIFLVHDGIAERIGFVVAASNATFSVQGRAFASGAAVHLRATLVGNSESISSESLLIQPDQDVVWTLENYLPNSSVWVQ